MDALTTAIQWGMERQILHIERGGRSDLIRAVEDLYRGDLVRALQEERGLASGEIDPLRISQSIADAVAYFEAHEPDARRAAVAGGARLSRAPLRVPGARSGGAGPARAHGASAAASAAPGRPPSACPCSRTAPP